MAPTSKKAINVPKTMTLPLSKVIKKTPAKKTSVKKMPAKKAASKKAPTKQPPAKKTPAKKTPAAKKNLNAKKPDAKQLELTQSFRVAKKPHKTILARNTLLPDPSTLTPEENAVVERHEKELAWLKKELARQKKAEEKRAQEIATKGYLYKGRWLPLRNRPDSVIKVEAVGEGTADRPIKVEEDEGSAQAVNACRAGAGVATTTLQDLLTRTPRDLDRTSTIRRRGFCGLDITKSFDCQYPLIAEMVENQMLDDEDDMGSLCDFVTADEWSDGDNMDVDG